jgi:acyl dehydratase
MAFNASLVGTRWGPLDWTVTPRRALAFRAVLAPDDAEALDDAARPLEMLPMQVVAPEWVLALESRADPAQTLSADEARRGVQAVQDTRFLRPVLAGETLTVTAALTAVRSSRAGAVATTVYESRVGAELVAVSTAVSVLRGVAVEGAETPASDDEVWPVFAPTAADPILIVTPRGFPHLYSECAEIWNPIHTERAVALAAGLPDILIHGTALWALAGLRSAPAGLRITRLAARFRSPAWAGEDLLLARGEAVGAATPFRLTAPDGRLLTEGFVEVAA